MSTRFNRFGLSCLAALSVLTSLAAGAAPPATPARAASPLPADSIYQLPLSLIDQGGQTFQLLDRQGQPMLVSMFYTSCQFVCPMLIDAIRATQQQLSEGERARLSVLMVSFDPAKDSVTVLKQTADERHLDPARWTLARTDPKSVRKLAAVLGIQYRQLANGEFNHSAALLLVDADGRIRGKTAQLGNADPAFVKQIRATLASPQTQP